MVVNDEVHALLTGLGLGDYEARAYTALIRCQPASAYEVAKQAGMPSSKVYETMGRLQEKGLAQPTTAGSGRGQRYMALNPVDLVYRKTREAEQRAARLGPLLTALSNQADADFVWQLAGAEAVQEKAIQLLDQAEQYLLVSLWAEEARGLEPHLSRAQDRGVRVAVVHFGPPSIQVGATFHHPAQETLFQEKGGRGLALVADGAQACIATFFASGAVEGAWSRNRAFVILAEDYIRHDVYITKLTATLDDAIKARFGAGYEELRDVFRPVPG